MASTYVNDLRLNELGTGDASGTWGTITNLNLELIGEGLSYGTQDRFTSNADATTTVADGASDPARAMYFKVTSSATLTATRTLTIAPNTVSRMQYIENATTGGQSINISQGSGSNVTIPTGATKAVYLDGAGSGAAVTDAFADLSVVTLDATTLQIGGTSVTATAAELNYNDVTTLGQVQASKTVTADSSGFVNFGDNERIRLGTGADLQIYHDGSASYIAENGTGSLFIQGTNLTLENSGGTNYVVCTSGGAVDLYHNGTSKLQTKSDGVNIGGELQATSLDINGNADISGQLTMGGNVNLQDNDILQLGSSQDLQIYHDGSNSYIADEGTGGIVISGGTLTFKNQARNETHASMTVGGSVDLYYDNSNKLQTKSDGVNITGELQCDTLDVDGNVDISGFVTLNADLDLQDNDKLKLGSGNDLQIYHNGTNSFIDDTGVGDLYIRASDDLFIQKYTGENMIVCNVDASVDLYYNGVTKLSTASDGVVVSGRIQSTNGSFQGASSLDKIVIGANDIDFYLNNSNEFRMQSDGDFHADADVIAYSTTVSDERLKTDIEKIENATDKVSQLNGYTFTYKADGKKSAGVIAQEVEKVLPSAVSEKELPLKTDDGVAYKTVQYDQIIGLLIESIKELKQEINELKGA